MNFNFKLIQAGNFQVYLSVIENKLSEKIDNLKIKTEITQDEFEFYLTSSSLYSSKIEGNSLDANSFISNRNKPNSIKKKEVTEIETLLSAYKFAFLNKLNCENILQAHYILSKTLLPISERGALRNVQVGIRDASSLKPIYLAVEPDYLKSEFDKLFQDIELILQSHLTLNETFYFASLLHLWIAMIHPFADGNGRAARLIEKWFLAQKIGEIAWSINSEKYYWDNRNEYYDKIAIGYNYYDLHWERSLPFLMLLPNSF
jgi:Fic family protein